MEEWFYAVGDDRHGPVESSEIEALLQSGTLARDSLVWRKGLEKWIQVQHTAFGENLSTPPSISSSGTSSEGTSNINLAVSGIPERVQVEKNVEFNVGIGKSISLAPISLGLAIAGFFTYVTFIPAVICGHIALSRCKRNPEEGGRGMALAAVIIGYIALLIPVLGLVFYSLFVGAVLGFVNMAEHSSAKVSQLDADYGFGIERSKSYRVEKLLNAATTPEIYDVVVEHQWSGNYQSILPYLDRGEAVTLGSGDIVKIADKLPDPDRPRLCLVELEENGRRYYVRKDWLAANSTKVD